MSELKGSVGSWNLTWKSVPRGPQGSAQVEVDGKLIDLRWRRDADGIWVEFPNGVKGYDLQGELDDEGRMMYRVSQRDSNGLWTGVSFRRSGEETGALAAGGKKKGVRVRAQMPGKIVRVDIQPGAQVTRDQPILVMEAMKMENEIRAPQSGKVSKVLVAQGQAVETGADLCMIDPE